MRRAFFAIMLLVSVTTSCSLAPRPVTDVTASRLSVPREQVAYPDPWEAPDADHEGISDIVIIASVVALVLFFIAWDQGWITPHF